MNLTLTTPQEMNLAQKCASCGSLAEKLYQHNVCKGCLQQSFEKMIPLINKFRNMNGKQGRRRLFKIAGGYGT